MSKTKSLTDVVEMDRAHITDRKIIAIVITPDLKVKISLAQTAELPPAEANGESQTIPSEFTIKSKHKPHSDLINKMKELRGHVLKYAEWEPEDATDRNKFAVSGVKIDGDVEDRTAILSIRMARQLPKAKFEGPVEFEFTGLKILDPAVYDDAKKVGTIMDAVIAEIWGYLDGKHEGEPQLPLFKK